MAKYIPLFAKHRWIEFTEQIQPAMQSSNSIAMSKMHSKQVKNEFYKTFSL